VVTELGGKMQSFILKIQERNHSWSGRPAIVTTHDTAEDAHAALVAYVLRNWPDEIGTDPPDDTDEMIDEYFEEVPERYTITAKRSKRA
jgi:mono/diheme cytochrome c family protein